MPVRCGIVLVQKVGAMRGVEFWAGYGYMFFMTEQQLSAELA